MGPFGDGDIINNMSLDPDIVLAGMHINVIAEDETLGTRIKNQIDISFTNECGVPSFNVGDSIGWVEIVSRKNTACLTCVNTRDSLTLSSLQYFKSILLFLHQMEDVDIRHCLLQSCQFLYRLTVQLLRQLLVQHATAFQKRFLLNSISL